MQALAQAQDATSAASTLPIRTVTLFTSGVSYTERRGPVTGSAEVPLTFHTAQINDILKSMVLIDNGGKVQPATYASKVPVSRSLQSFAVDVSQNSSLDEILGRMRGSRVSIFEAGRSIGEGPIVGIEKRAMGTSDKGAAAAQVSFVTLMTDSGLTSIPLDAGKTIQVLDERLNREFREALGLLATSTDDQKRQVKLHFAGTGRREVRVGYVMEAPIWKISYRLVIGGETAAAKPYLQGWALVENSTDEDWKAVRLSLVSGRPVSFIQDLYQPLYIPRPEVGPDIVASPFPQTHDENMLAQKRDLQQPVGILADNGRLSRAPGLGGTGRAGEKSVTSTVLNINGETIILNSGRRDGIKVGDRLQVFRDDGNGSRFPVGELLVQTVYATDSQALVVKNTGGIRPEDTAEVIGGRQTTTNTGMTNGQAGSISNELGDAFRKSVSAQASGQKTGEMFAYNISSPLNLPRQQAAMIPVIAQNIALDRLSLYNADTDGKYAMNALRLHNTTGQHLKGGSITLFDGGTYAGDARLEDVPPGDSRIVTYAVDLSMVCNRDTPDDKGSITSVVAHHGVLTTKERTVSETIYTLKSKASKVRTVLVEHPVEDDSHLVTPVKPTEKTAELYRFAVSVPAGKTVTLKVVTEKAEVNSVAILEGTNDSLYETASHTVVSPKLKAALQGVIARRKHVSELSSAVQVRKSQENEIGSDQDRIRKNMGALDRASALYKRYVAELDQQESHIAALRAEAAKLQKQKEAAERELRAYVDGIND
jgi:hypothetical protein